MNKNDKIAVIIIAFIALVYFMWDTPFAQKLRGVNNKTSETDNSTIDKLFNIVAPAPAKDDNFPLHIGSYGDNVKRLQLALNRINSTMPYLANNYAPLNVDSDFGQNTYNRILLLIGTSAMNGPSGPGYANSLSQTNWNQIITRSNNLNLK